MKKQYIVWKINIKNGDVFYVKSDIVKSADFINYILGNGTVGTTVTHFELAQEMRYSNGCYRTNSVAIIGTEVSSIEWYNEEI